MGVLESVGDLLSLLFSKDPAGAHSRKESRAIRTYLKSFKPPLCSSSGDELLPGFANAVLELAIDLRPAREVISRTVAASDVRIARRYRDMLVERRLDADARGLLGNWSFETLKARASAVADPETELARAEAEMRPIDLSLEGSNAADIDAELARFERLVDICRYDFGRLLMYFDHAADPDSPSWKPKFVSADATQIAGELVDLYSVVADFNVDAAALSDVVTLAEVLGGAEENARAATKGATRANRILASTLSAPTLTALIRVARKENSYRPPAPVPATSAVSSYRERLKARRKEDRERVSRELRERSMASDIEALFGRPPDGGLLAVQGFDDELNRRLQAGVSRSFGWILPLRILKTFEKRWLVPALVEAARRVAVEGFFESAAFRSRLTDAVGKLEKTGARIAAFEEAAGGQSRTSAYALRKALDESAAGKDSRDVSVRIASALDDRAKEIVDQDARSLRDLAEAIFDIIGDFKKPTPEIVTNIRTLAASKDKALMPTLVNGYNAIARFLKLMKAFMIVTPISGDGER
ncbi:MAG: hypothetical protein A2Z99_15205 [Treponema sp. GWB1_62_6]|nr:MAG: hypothetical protein A2Y36_06000 [Treponema sp. GWA1_62_8]OHE68089.1 MAG: hypothetical protein A2Z99_15205 [Treponema sp. GWB1_62_6]OHE68642.1 MAG: hypothetical protein A2001_05925 [Treponema sp. GWC1_61_84]OHE70379.1 MAG: hypothetical protein A2413_15225 [Treponema sp. RIFOXYC1_FULL_61_9]HCM26593.1 hypothetical protein [Treponema sp.]